MKPPSGKLDLSRALRDDLRHALARVGKLDLASVARHGLTLSGIHALTAGKVSFSATTVRRKTQRKQVLVARGSRAFSRPGKASVRLKLTSTGRKVLRGARWAALTVKGTFAAKTGRRVTASSKVLLTRKKARFRPNTSM